MKGDSTEKAEEVSSSWMVEFTRVGDELEGGSQEWLQALSSNSLVANEIIDWEEEQCDSEMAGELGKERWPFRLWRR